jgi:putative salt-induced outer membrane protein
MFRQAAGVLALIVGAAPAMAHEEEAEQDTGPWYGRAALGYLASSGNTENSNMKALLEIGYEKERWNHLFNALAINSMENEQTTAEAYEWGFKSELSFSEFNYLFGRLDWRKDRFSSYETQFSQTAGYGRRLLNNDRHNLDAEVGFGARQSELIDGTAEDEFIVRGGLKYTWAISENAEFRETLAVEAGDQNTYLESVTALSATLVGDLALVASYTVKHNTDVLPGLEETDTYSALSLEYLF